MGEPYQQTSPTDDDVSAALKIIGQRLMARWEHAGAL